jgi:hypothetical protein
MWQTQAYNPRHPARRQRRLGLGSAPAWRALLRGVCMCAYLEEEVVAVRGGVGLGDGSVAGAQLGDGGAWAWARRRRGGHSQLVRRAPHEEALGSGTTALGSGTETGTAAAWRRNVSARAGRIRVHADQQAFYIVNNHMRIFRKTACDR